MGIQPPGFYMVFFEKLNFISIGIPVVSEDIRATKRFIQIYENWMESVNLFQIFKEAVT
jgi:hypothetical protein